MSTDREFIIVGQDQGRGYTLWDVALAPTDPTRLAEVLEEVGVDAMDACGEMTTQFGATAREAVDAFLAEMRERSGLDDYALTADSQTDGLGEPEPVGTPDVLWASPQCPPAWSSAKN